jgi:hypothetical protein
VELEFTLVNGRSGMLLSQSDNLTLSQLRHSSQLAVLAR